MHACRNRRRLRTLSKDDVGDDLNLIVQLIMADLLFPSPESLKAVLSYASARPHSYGSYLTEYRNARRRYDQHDGADQTKASRKAGSRM